MGAIAAGRPVDQRLPNVFTTNPRTARSTQTALRGRVGAKAHFPSEVRLTTLQSNDQPALKLAIDTPTEPSAASTVLRVERPRRPPPSGGANADVSGRDLTGRSAG